MQGGSSASAQLHQVAERLKMQPTTLSPAFTITRDMPGEDGQIKNISESFEPYVDQLTKASKELLKNLEIRP
jgi:hypothetical protein